MTGKLRVLLVEDHRELAETTGAYLEACGHEVDFAADGVVALHLGVTETYDVVVLDIMLPGVDGFAVCRRLREDAKVTTPIIMLTARDQLDDKLTGFDAGADDYLVKPFDMPELAARIEALARRAEGLTAIHGDEAAPHDGGEGQHKEDGETDDVQAQAERVENL